MKQAWKRLLIALSFVFLVTLSLAIFAACNDDEEQDEEKTTYTITVLLPNNSPAVGVKFTFTKADGGDFLQEFTTDNEGKITAELPEDNYRVSAVESTLPTGYTVSGDLYTVNFRGLPQTVRLVTAPSLVNYSFKVTGPAGAPLGNIAVLHAATATGIQSLLGQTNADGELDISVSAIEGYVFITPPVGYEYNRDYGNNSIYKISKTGGSVTFTLLKNNRISNVLMTTEERETFYAAIGSSTFQETAIDKGVNAYTATATLDAGETQYFVFRPLVTGVHTLYANKTSECEVRSLGDSYNIKQYLDAMAPSKSMGMGISCTAMQDYVFTVNAKSAETVQLVIVAPPVTNNYSVSQTGEHTVQIKENLPAMLYFRPSESGEYTITIQNGTSGYHMQQISPATLAPIIGEESVNGTMVIKATYSELFDANGDPSSNKWIFRITSTADNPSYPIELTVTITRTGDAIEKVRLIEHAAVQENLTKYADQAGTLTAVGVTGNQVVKGSDGYYHYGNANGPIDVVKLKGEINPFYVGEDGAKLDFSTLDQSGNNYYNFFTNSDDTHDYYVSYARFLRGYADFSAEPTMEVQEYYLKYVNKDGVYPLNDELKVFLEYVARDNASWFKYRAGSSAQDDYLWLFSAFYYDESSPAPASLNAAPLALLSDDKRK